MEKILANLIIVATVILAIIFVYYLPRAIKARRAKKKAANANSNKKERALGFFVQETIQEKVLALFNEMSIREIGKNKEGIEKYLFKNFALNLKVYTEGIGLIDSKIESPQKRETIKKILDDIIYTKTRIPFLTKNGLATSSSFATTEEYWELASALFYGSKKMIFIN